MKRIVQICLVSATLGLLGCAEPGRYPLSEEQCGPSDPVQEMNAADCIVPGS